MFSIACYIGDTMPALVYLVYKYLDQSTDDLQGCFEETVLANTNCGGENCHRFVAADSHGKTSSLSSLGAVRMPV
jgi:hypothetical protein